MRVPLLLVLLTLPSLRAMDPPARKTHAEIRGRWEDVGYEARLSAHTLRFDLTLPGVHLCFSQNGVRQPVLAVLAKAGNGAIVYEDIAVSGPRLLRLLGDKAASLAPHLDKAEEVGRKAAEATGDPAVLAQVEAWAGALGALRWALTTTEPGKELAEKGKEEAQVLQELDLGEQVSLRLTAAGSRRDVILEVPWFCISAPLEHFRTLEDPKAAAVEMTAGQSLFRFESMEAFHRKQAELVRAALSAPNQAYLAQALREALETLWKAPSQVSGSTLGRIADAHIRGLYRQLRRAPASPAPEPETPWTVPILKPTLGTDESLPLTQKADARFVRASNGDLLATLRIGAFSLHVQDRKAGREAWMSRDGRETPRRAMGREEDLPLMASPEFRKDFEGLAPGLGAGFAADLEEALAKALEGLDDPTWSRMVLEPLLSRMAELLRELGA